jgi:titin
LRAQTIYRLTAYALNKAGRGANATEVTCFTATSPGVPGTPSLVTSTGSSIEVKWEPAFDDGGSPIKEYQLHMDEVEGLSTANLESWTLVFTGQALQYNVQTGLTGTKQYRFKVRSVSEHDRVSPFSGVSVYYAAPLPAKITFDTASNAHLKTSKYSIWLTWVLPAIAPATQLPIDAYVVYWDEGYRSSGNFSRLAKVEAYKENFYNVTGGILKTGHTYRFQVTAINRVGEGPVSDEVSARAASLPGRPGQPERTSSVVVPGPPSTATIELRWYQQELADTGGVPLTGFKLYYYQKADSSTVKGVSDSTLGYDGTGAPGVTQATVTGLEIDKDYAFFVTALNPDEGPASDHLVLRAAAFPSAVATLTEVPGSRTGTSIGLSWLAPDSGGSPILAYTLVLVEENKSDVVMYHGPALAATLEGLTAGHEHQYRIKATTLVGDSPWSDVFKFLIVDEPTPPLRLQLISFDDTFVSFSWQQPLFTGGQPLTGFKVYREDCSAAVTTYTLLTSTPLDAGQFQYTDSTPVGGRDYRYFVTATNQAGLESEKSSGLPITPIKEPIATAAPTLVSKGKDFITVKWVAPGSDGGSPITAYHLFVRPEYAVSYVKVYSGIQL